MKRFFLIKLAIDKHTKLDNLKKKIAALKDSECLMEEEKNLKKYLDPAYNWLFTTVCSKNGLKTLQDIETDLLNIFLDFSNFHIELYQQNLSLFLMSRLRLEYRILGSLVGCAARHPREDPPRRCATGIRPTGHRRRRTR